MRFIRFVGKLLKRRKMVYYTPTECNTLTNHLIQNVFNQLSNIRLTHVTITPEPSTLNFRIIEFVVSFRNFDTIKISLEMKMDNTLDISITGGNIKDTYRLNVIITKLEWSKGDLRNMFHNLMMIKGYI